MGNLCSKVSWDRTPSQETRATRTGSATDERKRSVGALDPVDHADVLPRASNVTVEPYLTSGRKPVPEPPVPRSPVTSLGPPIPGSPVTSLRSRPFGTPNMTRSEEPSGSGLRVPVDVSNVDSTQSAVDKDHMLLEDHDLEQQVWWYGTKDRQRANDIMKGSHKPGTFLVRFSPGSNTYVLHVLGTDRQAKLYKILVAHHRCYISVKRQFSSLHQLVVHYSKNADGLTTKLTEPAIDRIAAFDEILKVRDFSDGWEVKRSNVEIGQLLGSGEFGEVRKGRFQTKKGKKVDCAVKVMKDSCPDPKFFLQEADIMKELDHRNVVQLLGIVARERPVWIILHFEKYGDLCTYVRKFVDKIDRGTLLRICAEIACGMAHLESKLIIHRDLAARNILLSGDNGQVKIADFGLAMRVPNKEASVSLKGGVAQFPVRWTSPEAVKTRTFSIKADVWSFGIVCMECFQFGKIPYASLTTNAEVTSELAKGARMKKPRNMEPEFYELVSECWSHNPAKRPWFVELKRRMAHCLTQEDRD